MNDTGDLDVVYLGQGFGSKPTNQVYDLGPCLAPSVRHLKLTNESCHFYVSISPKSVLMELLHKLLYMKGSLPLPDQTFVNV